MSRTVKTRQVAEFGDFQTPTELARQVCELLLQWQPQPKTLVEPTCGLGNFLFTALDQFPSITKAIGLDISPTYVEAVKLKLADRGDQAKVSLVEGNFFTTDWSELLAELPDPILVVGNPPWVTNAHLSNLNSSNVPEKTNFQKYNGFDAMTGKSNFDISEWMLIRALDWLNNRDAVMGMLCKTAVARKLLAYAWKNNINLADSAIYHFNAAVHFSASVDACLLICKFTPGVQKLTSRIYENFSGDKLTRTIGSRDGSLVASVELFERWKHLSGDTKRWRSGIKHDCAKVIELTKEGDKYRNGFGEIIELEEDFIYPMLKSSDVANESSLAPRRWMLVPQKDVRDDTSLIKDIAPKTWQYLITHAPLFDRRGSSIYNKRPRFSIFGVGNYSFSPWKIAVSGFYKKIYFKVIGNIEGRPIVLDDTSYFLSCETKNEAELIASLLNSDISKEFFEAYIFWDAKRPITIDVLRRLDLAALERAVCTGTNTTHCVIE
jgi:hypothetical protein